MKTVNILEETDIVDPEDWCRPLDFMSMNGGRSDHYSFRNQYSGEPANNAKWIKVREVFNQYWFGKTVKEISDKLFPYEFIRGFIPKKHLFENGMYRKDKTLKVR